MGDATAVADLVPSLGSQKGLPSTAGHGGPAIWERIRLRVEDRLQTVELHAHRLLDRELTGDELAAAASAAGSLGSELGRLELPGIAQLARHLAKTLSGKPLGAGDAIHLAGTTDDIRTLVSSAIAQQESTANTRGTIVAVGSSSAHLDGICWVLASRGHGIAHDPDRLAQAARAPSGVLASIGGLGPAARSLLQAIRENWAAPIVALYDDARPETLELLAAHCSTIMPSTVSADMVSAEFARFETAQAVSPVLYAHGHLPRPASRLLRAHGFRVRRMAALETLPGLLENDDAAVIFGDTASPTDVLSMTRVIRATPAIRRTPVVWLAPHTSEQPEQGRRLNVATVSEMTDGVASQTNWLVRVTAADPLDAEKVSRAILGWSAARVLTDRSLVAAHRTGSNVVLALIGIDANVTTSRLDHILDTLSREFRRGDIIGLRDDRTVVVVLQGLSRRAATARISALMQRLDLEEGSSGAGVSMFPNDGRTGDELVRAADRARQTAMDAGGPSVVSTGWRPFGQQAADVLVVEPDPVLAAILGSAIQERGHRAEVLDSGHVALNRMTGQEHGTVPRLLLVDIDAAGLDGLTLVRHLRRAGVLTHVNVLLMTARSSESDLRVALDLGVADVIRKPFSTTLLLHRVNQLLEER